MSPSVSREAVKAESVARDRPWLRGELLDLTRGFPSVRRTKTSSWGLWVFAEVPPSLFFPSRLVRKGWGDLRWRWRTWAGAGRRRGC